MVESTLSILLNRREFHQLDEETTPFMFPKNDDVTNLAGIVASESPGGWSSSCRLYAHGVSKIAHEIVRIADSNICF
ncbi:hypothetical protein BLNAU_10747 [Blattamonas nauphoetae]|uniref:Uncharacterized protein n=1 Tax=Blattamonas nauphoetae TaxID=2049346 RepID=A0ABQ9XPD0_9EUKA|nr:hypothetical protein BLNAU_10747 [Blattamonas nauphoetae]